MKLLQNSWSDLLVLDHLYQRMHYQLPDEIQLANGQKFDLLSLALLGTSTEAEALNQVQSRLAALKLDPLEYLCLKFLLLLNPGNLAVKSVSRTHALILSLSLFFFFFSPLLLLTFSFAQTYLTLPTLNWFVKHMNRLNKHY